MISIISPHSRALWTPDQLGSKLKAWYDPSDEDTITESSGNVSQVDDLSGHDYHMAQSVAANKPRTGDDTIGGLNVLTFGSSVVEADYDFLRASIAAGVFPSSMQVTMLLKKEGLDVGDTAISRSLVNKPAPIDRRNAILLMGDGSTFKNAQNPPNDIAGMTTPTIISYGVNSTQWWEWEDGSVSLAKGNHSGTYGDAGTTMEWGDRGDGAGEYEGLMAEAVVTTELTDSERKKLTGYIAWKWDLVASLPGGHQYKSAPPRI